MGILKKLSPLGAPLMVLSILLPSGQGISYAKEPVKLNSKSTPKPSPKPTVKIDRRENHSSRSSVRVGTPRGNRVFAQRYTSSAYKWNGSQFVCLDKLWQKESGWNHKAHNRSSGAHGIAQALPGSKMSRFGKDWYSNPIVQIKWGSHYIKKRYGTPCNAWAHSKRTGWY